MAKKKEPSNEVKSWLAEIASSKKREKDYRKEGEEIIEIYSGKKAEQIPFNILFSNTETLLPALFSQTPRPVVQRRFKDEDPIGKAAATAAQRMLEFLCDTNVEGYETYEQSMRHATLDGLLPGRGVTAIKYDAEIVEPENENPVVKWEQVCTDPQGWDKVYFGYAKKWSKVPWIAYEEYLDKDECTRLFGDIAGKIEYTTGEEDEEKGTGTGGKDDEQGKRKTALIYQIWDKSDKVIRYVSPAYTDEFLKVEDDPLNLTGFFNCPRPLQFIEKTNDLVPTAMYKLYENQAKELNTITRRLQKVISALKVRGAYDGSLGNELEQIMNGEDNTLIPTDKGASLAAEGGLEKAIWFMPLEKLITVATNLVASRQQCKQVIYEISGVSDIIRGQSVASETLGAQKIKESWGTMRLKRLQKEVQRYARDTMRIMLEIAASKMSADTWARATGLPFVTAEQKQQAQMILQASQAQGTPDPQAMQVLQSIAWDDVLKLLQDDLQRAYRIDIETNSTIDVEATEDQKQIGDFMNAMGQLMAGLTPMVESGAMQFEAAQSLLLAVVRRFRFGTEVEDHFKNMKPPEKDNPEVAAAQQEMAKAQQESQVAMQELEQEKQTAIAEAQMAMSELQQKAQQAQAELAQKVQQEKEQLVAEMNARYQEAIAEFNKEKMKLESTRQIEQMKANTQRDTELKKTALMSATQIEIARINACAQMQKNESEQEDSMEEDSVSMMNTIVETQNRLLEQLNKPKTAKFSDGRTVTIS